MGDNWQQVLRILNNFQAGASDIRRRLSFLEANVHSADVHNVSWAGCVSAFLALPALRALWTMASVDYQNPQVPDIACNTYDLTNNNAALFGYDGLAPYASFAAASTQYLSRADGGAANWADIRGNEAYVVGSQQGLTLGGWVQVATAAGGTVGLWGKWNTAGGANQRSYLLQKSAAGNYEFLWSALGAVATTLTGPGYTADTWQFVVGKWIPNPGAGNNAYLFVDGTWYSRANLDATLFDSTASFVIGAYDNGATGYIDGKAGVSFLSACAVPDDTVEALYERTRAMYGV